MLLPHGAGGRRRSGQREHFGHKTADGYVLNGLKTWVTAMVQLPPFHGFVQTESCKEVEGAQFLFVPRDTPGVSVSKPFNLLGTRTTQICESGRSPGSSFCLSTGCARRPGHGQPAVHLAEIRSMTAGLESGLVRAALHDCIQYATNVQPSAKRSVIINSFRAKVAGNVRRLEAAKLLTYRATHMIDDKIPCLPQGDRGEIFGYRSGCKAGDYATRIFGAYGYSMEYRAAPL